MGAENSLISGGRNLFALRAGAQQKVVGDALLTGWLSAGSRSLLSLRRLPVSIWD